MPEEKVEHKERKRSKRKRRKRNHISAKDLVECVKAWAQDHAPALKGAIKTTDKN